MFELSTVLQYSVVLFFMILLIAIALTKIEKNIDSRLFKKTFGIRLISPSYGKSQNIIEAKLNEYAKLFLQQIDTQKQILEEQNKLEQGKSSTTKICELANLLALAGNKNWLIGDTNIIPQVAIREVEKAKAVFWRAHNLAAKLKFRVQKSFKDYL